MLSRQATYGSVRLKSQKLGFGEFINNTMELEKLRNSCLRKVENKDQYQLERVQILSPYLSEQFINNLNSLRPRKITITTDAACSSSVIESISNNYKNQIDKINLAHCDGIVHAKCYLFHWKNQETNKFRRLFLWGSCNATDGGFRRNAEVFSWVNLSKLDGDQRKILLNYFRKLIDFKQKVCGIQLNLENGVSIELPSITKYSPDAGSFDLWIQKGRLCHPFPNDPSFRHLRLTLKSKMSRKDELSDALIKNNIGINQQTTISYDYLRNDGNMISDSEIDDDFTSSWKSKYFIDTVYGLWTSEGCFIDNNKGFHKTDNAKRKKEIDAISNASESQREKWCGGFLEVIKVISKSISNPSEYFHYKDGKLDINKYREQFSRQLNRDFLRSKDAWFKHGYISGYDFPEVPPMRELTLHWDELIQSFSDSLSFEINKARTRNRLAQTVRDYTDIGYPIYSDTLLNKLRTNWFHHKETIECFYYEE